MKLNIRVKDGKIVEAKHKVFGCGSAISSSDYAAEKIIGQTLEEASTLKNQDIAKHLSLPPVKLHCSMLAEDAVQAAIKDYEKKQLLKCKSSTDSSEL
jgi:nitrogen fixation NifU-like protein